MNSGIIEYLVKSGISLAVLYILYWLFLRNEKTFRFNRCFLLSSIIASYIIPLINFSGLFSREVALSLPGTAIQNFIGGEKIIPFEAGNTIAAQPQIHNFNFYDYLLYIYIVVLSLLVIRMILGLIKLFLMYKRGNINKMGEYSIVYTKENIAPFSFLKYIFLNEKNIDIHNLNQIITHEIVHIKQHHTVDTLFVSIAAILQWYNPFIWLIKKSLKDTHEFLADEKVIAQGFDSASYSELLVTQIAGAKAMDFANCFNHLLIKKRLIMMNKLKPGRLAFLKKIIIAPLALLLILAFNIQGQDVKNIKKLDVKKAPKPYLTDQQREARKDSILNLKSPSFMDKNFQTSIIGMRNIVLPKEEKDDNGYCYIISTAVDLSTGKFEVNASKAKVTKEGKTIKNEKPMAVNIINYEEFKDKLPVLSKEELNKLKASLSNNPDNKGHFSMFTLSSINSLKNNVEYWKTHK